MEHYKEGQYDDDLTAGIEEWDEDFDSGEVDLFDYVGDDESPLSRLKSIILSIDWEITDDILRQFNEELQDLEDIWAGNKINLIYVQALAKISRYIYKEKASAHPSAIKLLLTFYANLEKIVSDEEMSEREQKNLLRTDIERFEKLKEQIGSAAAPAKPSPATKKPRPETVETVVSPVEIEEDFAEAATIDAIIPPSDEVIGKPGEEDPLLNLKAIVYGIDWEITERDLNNLSREVKRLEKEFITSRVKQIFLQGIGSLGAYINVKRSDAHVDAFKLLHSFFTGLEKVVRENLSGQAEKNVLLPEVEKFNAFKALIADTISPDSLAKSTAGEEDEEDESYEEIQPAFADVSEDVHGFQEEEEAAALEQKPPEETVDEYFEEDEEEPRRVEEDSQLATEMESRLQGMFDEPGPETVLSLDADTALRGVDVESDADDDSDEEPLPEEDGELSPALAADAPREEQSPAVFTEKVEEFFPEVPAETVEPEAAGVAGVDVEHEADDDTEEVPLRFEEDGEFAPALSGAEEAEEAESSRFQEVEDTLDTFFGEDEEGVVDEKAANIEELKQQEPVVEAAGDIEERLTDFFGESEPETMEEVGEEALEGVTVETAEDDDSEEVPLPYENGELAPALAAEEDEESALSVEELSDEELAAEPLAETEEAEEHIDDLFGEEEEFAADEEEVFSFAEEAGADEEEALPGVEVETPEDDDSQEEPLALEEDGELAPALGAGAEEEVLAEKEEDEAAESEVGDRFDTFFEAEEQVPEEQELVVSEENLPEEVEEAGVPQKADLEESLEETLFFEEEPIEEEPSEEEVEEPLSGVEEEAAAPQPSEEDEIMTLLGEEEDLEDSFAAPSEEIRELSPEELDAVITEEDETVVKATGSVPSGYPSTDELLREFGELAGEEEEGIITHPAGNEDFIIGIEGHEEEEVIFEPVDEDIEEQEELFEPLSEEAPILDEAAAKRAALEESVDYEDESEFFGTTMLADEPKLKRPREAEKMAAFEAETLEEEDESGYIERPGEIQTEDVLADLRDCIVSLGLEIDDSILDSLNEEIEKLRVAWLDRPAEKTFIQLLSTIAGHIERYRYEADAEANRLLLSVFDKLELSALGRAEGGEIQEAILSETSKVLQWQARLIDRASATTGEKAPAPDFAVRETIALTEEKISEGLDDMSKKVDEIGDDMLMQKVSTIMKAEMEQLKTAFHDELRELRQELMRRK